MLLSAFCISVVEPDNLHRTFNRYVYKYTQETSLSLIYFRRQLCLLDTSTLTVLHGVPKKTKNVTRIILYTLYCCKSIAVKFSQ